VLLVVCALGALALCGPAAGAKVHRPSHKAAVKAALTRVSKLAEEIRDARDKRSPCTDIQCSAAGAVESCRLGSAQSKVWVCRAIAHHLVHFNEAEDETFFHYLIFVRYASSKSSTLRVTDKLLKVEKAE
jgi:hypothetical protein